MQSVALPNINQLAEIVCKCATWAARLASSRSHLFKKQHAFQDEKSENPELSQASVLQNFGLCEDVIRGLQIEVVQHLDF